MVHPRSHTLPNPGGLRRRPAWFPVITATLITSFGVVAGCTNQSPRGSEESALAFVEGVYADVLTGQDEVCEQFTPEGLADFVTDMTPAADCTEAVDVLNNAVGAEQLAEFTASHQFSIETSTASTVTIRADFGNYADLMTASWVDGRWLAGPTERTMSVQPQEPVPAPS